jgi:hypothetical protein
VVGSIPQSLLQIKAAWPRHSNIEQNASMSILQAGEQEIANIRETSHLVADGAQKTRDCFDEEFVVVDEVHDGCLGCSLCPGL